jgi:hypothetical protein
MNVTTQSELAYIDAYVFIRVGLEQGSSAEESHPTLRHIVGWNLQSTKLAANVQNSPENVSFSLDPKTLGNTLKVSERAC